MDLGHVTTGDHPVISGPVRQSIRVANMWLMGYGLEAHGINNWAVWN